jgi:hypothetical protein
MCVVSSVKGVVREMGQDLVPRLGMSGTITLLHIYVFMRVQGQDHILSCMVHEVAPGGMKYVALSW